jgi:hypothetical protein
MPSEAIVMPSWHADRYSSAHGLEAALRRAHQRELRSHEKAVQGDQNGDAEQEQQLGHLRPGFFWLLRGGSSSLMR